MAFSSSAGGISPQSPATVSATDGSSEILNKVETAAVKRFKKYDKLCKTCPTLLQPKITTLEEMIMGLSVTEREELLANVARRIQQQQEEEMILLEVDQDDGGNRNDVMNRRIQTSKDVYEFQTGEQLNDETLNVPSSERRKRRKNMEPMRSEARKNNGVSGESRGKILEKMDKARSKFERNKLELARVQYLLDHTTEMLLTSRRNNHGFNSRSTISIHNDNEEDDEVRQNSGIGSRTSSVIDSKLYHCLDELNGMSRKELKMQRLKYVAQKMKYMQKIAKGRLKLYGTSLKLSEEKN